MSSDRIPFTGIKNARDLGGIETADGHKIKKRKLIKSGSISEATAEDLRILLDDYKVKVIVDLRTQDEKDRMPDPCIPGVAQIWNPLFKHDIQGVGVFKPDDSDVLLNQLKSIFVISSRDDLAVEEATRQVREMIKTSGLKPELYMARLYQKFINNQIIQKQVKQLFGILANNRHGAILWHCSAGRDRTGMFTALLLYALGVPKETIIEDYKASAETSEDAVAYLVDKLFPGNDAESEAYRALAREIFNAKGCYIETFFKAIETDYVSIDNYLQKAVELHVDNLVRLKTLYLK